MHNMKRRLLSGYKAVQRLVERIVTWAETVPVPGRLMVAVGVLVLAGGYALTGFPSVYAAFILTLIVILTGTYWYRKSGRDPFHPMVFPVFYVSFAMLAPAMYIAVTGNPVGHNTSASLDRPVVVVMLLTTLAWFVGSLTLLGLTKPRKPRPADALSGPGAALLVRTGRWLLALVVIGKLAQVVLLAGKRYGVGLTAGSATGTLTTAVEGLFLVAILVVVVGNLGRGRRPMALIDWAAFSTVAGLSLVFLSSRGELIAPAIIIAWAYTRRRRVRFRLLAVLSLVVVAGFTIVGNIRNPGNRILQVDPVARALVDTSSPYLITDNLTRIVPSQFDYELGSTYLAALKSWPSGVISQWLNGGPPETGAYVYREMINYTDPNSGIGFSLPSEGYLNFGLWGVFVSALLVGATMALAHGRSASERKGFYGGYAYPVLIAAVPYGLRSDALSQLKTTVYPILILGIILGLVRMRDRALQRATHLNAASETEVSGEALRARMVVISDTSIVSQGDGKYASVRADLSDATLGPYLDTGMRCVLVARQVSPEADYTLQSLDDPRITFHALSEDSKRSTRVMRIVRTALESFRIKIVHTDIVIVRVPESLGSLFWFRAKLAEATVVSRVATALSDSRAKTAWGSNLSGALGSALVRLMVRRSAAVIYDTPAHAVPAEQGQLTSVAPDPQEFTEFLVAAEQARHG